MLDIKVKPSNESLDFGKVTINLVNSSPLFNAEIATSYISYNFTILTTPTNNRLLKIPAIIESAEQFEDFKVDVIINNSKEMEADLYIKEANEKFIKLQLKTVDFDTAFLDDKLSTFDYGADIDIGPATSDVFAAAKTANTLAYPDTDYVFPMVYNSDFYGTDNVEFLDVINNYNIVAAIFVANTDAPVKNKNTLVPYFFLLFILKKIFESNGVTLKGEFIDDFEIQKLIIHNNFALDEFDITKTFVRASLTSDFLLPNSTGEHLLVFDDDSTFPNEDTGANYDTILGEFTLNQEGILNIKLFNLTITNYTSDNPSYYGYPRIAISMYVDGVERGVWYNYFQQNATRTFAEIIVSGHYVIINGVEYYVDTEYQVSASEIGKKVVIKSYIIGAGNNPNPSAKIHSGAIMEINLDKWSDFNVLSKTITPSNHMPNLTAKKFVNSFIKGFKLIPYYDKVKKELELNFFENLITAIKYNDISDYIESSTIKKIDNKGFAINYNFSGDNLKPEVTPDVSKFQYIGEYDAISDISSPSSVSLMVFIKNENAYYVSQITTGITWVRYLEGYEDFKLLDGSSKYLIDYSPFIMGNVTVDNDGAATMREFLLPKIIKKGSSNFYSIGINNPLFKVMLWHGMVDGPTAAKPYPFASSYNIDQNSVNIGALSLKLSIDSDSVYNQYLANYFNFLLATKKVEHVYTSNLQSPLTYNFSEKKLIINQRYLTGKLKLKITKNGFESIVAENYKV